MKSYQISHGYGILLVNKGTSFSSGFFFMIGLTPEICWTGRTFTYSYDCVCTNCPLEETLEHLFWNCPFAEICWDFICPSRRKEL
jgi:hypothetical protein